MHVYVRESGRKKRAVILSISPAPALWFLWGTDVHNLIQCLIPSTHYLQCQHHQLSAHAQTHKQAHTYSIVSWETQSYIAVLMSGGVFTDSTRRGLFIVHFPLCSGGKSCSRANTWFNQVSLPPLSICTSVGQLWQWSYSTWNSVQRKHMDAVHTCTKVSFWNHHPASSVLLPIDRLVIVMHMKLLELFCGRNNPGNQGYQSFQIE